MSRAQPFTANALPRIVCLAASLLPMARLLASDWPAAVSAFGRQFHRFAPDEARWARHDVSLDLVNWTDAGLAMPSLPAGKVLGVCGIEVGSPVQGAPPMATPGHALLVLVDSGMPSLHLLHSRDGRSYAIHERSPSLRVPGATVGNLSLIRQSQTQGWVLGIPILEARGSAILFHGSTNLLDWVPMGRVDGDHAQGGLCELPVRGGAATSRWVLVDSRGDARVMSWDRGSLHPEPQGIKSVRGQGRWAFLPVPGILPPRDRRLVVGLAAHGGDWAGGTPWEAALEESDAARQMVWLPAAESEGLRTRSRLLSLPPLSKPGTNQLLDQLPPACEIRLEIASSPHLRLRLRLSTQSIGFDAAQRVLSLGTNAVVLPTGDDMARWTITRTPSQIEVVASGGRVRMTTDVSPTGKRVLWSSSAQEVGGLGSTTWPSMS